MAPQLAAGLLPSSSSSRASQAQAGSPGRSRPLMATACPR